MIKELDTVILSLDSPEHGLKRRGIGAVVYCYKDGEAFKVEFITGEDKTSAVMRLKMNDVRLMQDKEILHPCQRKSQKASCGMPRGNEP